MKKFFEFCGLAAIIVFSFYYTEKAALFIQDKNPIMKSIKENKSNKDVESVNAIIEDNTIIPGINGLSVNELKSFQTMNSIGVFNEYYLHYDVIEPTVSLNNNKDKIIISGNKSINNISIVVESISHANIINSVTDKFHVVSDLDNFNNQYNIINMESNSDEFKELNKILDKGEKNSKICLTNTRVNISNCKSSKYYLVRPSIIFMNNLSEFKSSLSNGSIIYISESSSNDNVSLLLNEVQFRGFNIVLLNDLISEEYNYK